MTDAQSIRRGTPRDTVQITLPDGEILEGPIGTRLDTFLCAVECEPEVPTMAALVNGNLRELTYAVEQDSHVQPIDLGQSDGGRIYRRSLTFLLVATAHRLFPDVEIFVDHSLPYGGYFCEVRNRDPLTGDEIAQLEAEMRRTVEADIPITREEVPLDDALATFEARNESDKTAVFEGRDRKRKAYLRLYGLGDFRDYFHGYMVPSTGYLKFFQLLPWEEGFILQFPRRHAPTELQTPIRYPQLMRVFQEYGDWLRLLDTDCVGSLNHAIQRDRISEIILVSEALHERRISGIARQIYDRRDQIRLVLIAGPSSSGKTTFSKRLAVQLLAHGIRPFALELDNYFVNREDTPKDANGEYDFEALDALDLACFNEQLQALMRGDEVQLPNFNFYSGMREPGRTVQLKPGQLILVEGIHGLNPKLVYSLQEEILFRVYVSALTQLNLDRHNRVPTTDTRLIRRVTRDARTRGYSATETLQRWESVRRGEKRHIFPYQEYADVMFNSALVYELAVLKPFAEPLLLQVDPDSPQWVESKRLLKFLQWFQPVDRDLVPENSLLREFVGGLALEQFHWE